MTDATTIAFVVYPGLTILDLVGPLQTLGGLQTVEDLFGTDTRHQVTVVGESLDVWPTDTPLRVAAQATFDDVPHPDIIVVPGGGRPTLRQLGNDRLLDYLREVDRSADVVASVCTGALILAAAGLLNGRRATTHWGYHHLLDRLGATYVPERWVEDGRYLTAAGVSSGIDMALYLVERLTNADMARAVQLGIEYDPHPPQGSIDWSTVDRDMLRPVVEANAKAALADHPDVLARLVG
jgi:transcriptional regulator GlxA family with amidase domain